MKTKNIIFVLLWCCSLIFSACHEETGRVVYPNTTPQLSGFTVSSEQQFAYGDSLYFSLHITCPETPLSTLEVSLISEGKQLYYETIRTKGNDVQIANHALCVPFSTDKEDQDVALVLTAINVEGGKQEIVKQLQLVRPDLPETLYLHYGEEVVEMKRQTDNPFVYATDEGTYPETFSGRISTSPQLESSKYIWGYSDVVGYAALSNPTGGAFNFDYTDWNVKQVTFNAYTFKIGAIGVYQKLTINDVEMEMIAGYYKTSLNLETNANVSITGIPDLENAYNRDFFVYNSSDKSLTFTGPSGTWDICYSPKYNYIWVSRMTDVAPTAFWLVGHGFTAAPKWHEDYASGGWGLEDIFRLGYIVNLGNNKYQTTVYLNHQHEWGTFEVEIYSNLGWGKDDGMLLQEGSLSGDTEGFKISRSNGITSDSNFVPGYFRLTFDTSKGVGNETLHIKRLSY